MNSSVPAGRSATFAPPHTGVAQPPPQPPHAPQPQPHAKRDQQHHHNNTTAAKKKVRVSHAVSDTSF